MFLILFNFCRQIKKVNESRVTGPVFFFSLKNVLLLIKQGHNKLSNVNGKNVYNVTFASHRRLNDPFAV